MATDQLLPGSPQQQSLLRTIASLYAGDDRILAILVFGSLGRGTWDAYSDLDLAVVVRDDVQVDIPGELSRVSAACAERGERALFAEAAGDEGYLVLESLSCIALRYHSLQSMSPYVLEGWHVLVGSLDAETITAAARAASNPEPTLGHHVHRALWLALGVDVALQRRQFWAALPALERMRGALLDVFAATHGSKRAYRVFEEAAPAELRAKFGRTFPQYSPNSPVDTTRSLGAALVALLDLLEHDLDNLSHDQVLLGPGEREVIGRLRARVKTVVRRQPHLFEVLDDGRRADYSVEEWDETHPRWREFVACLETVAPEQAPFVLGETYRAHPSHLLVALQSNEVVGFIRFAVQPIGPEAKCPALVYDGVQLTEAKIHAFAVREEARGQGIGTELQRQTIVLARVLGCYQVASYSSYGRDANYQVKLSLGFGAQPEVHGDNHQGVYFIMPLRSAAGYTNNHWYDPLVS